jgi:hypothetical protein
MMAGSSSWFGSSVGAIMTRSFDWGGPGVDACSFERLNARNGEMPIASAATGP